MGIRLPAKSVVYPTLAYDKTIDRLSSELISNSGDLRITEQTLNYIKFLTPSGEAEFEDTFSGTGWHRRASSPVAAHGQ